MTVFLLQTALLVLLCFLGGYFVARLAKRGLYCLAVPRRQAGDSADSEN